MIVIGLTGGIASGKSTIAAELKTLGIPVFDADAASKDAVAKGSEGLRQVIASFGAEYLTAEGELNRVKISELVFQDKNALQQLEKIIHTIVWNRTEKFLNACRDSGEKIAVLDVPLLIECGWHKKVDQVWVVSVSVKEQVRRAMLRSGLSEDAVRARIAAQMPLTEKMQYADTVIDNGGDVRLALDFVRREIKRLTGENFGG